MQGREGGQGVANGRHSAYKAAGHQASQEQGSKVLHGDSMITGGPAGLAGCEDV